MWELTIKKAEHWRIDAFELWCWRILLRVSWTAKRYNQHILKEISPEYSLEGLMLKLKLQYFGHLKRRTDLFEKTLMLGKTEGRRTRGWQRTKWLMASLTHRHEFSKLQELVMDRENCRAAVHGVTKRWTRLSNWTELITKSSGIQSHLFLLLICILLFIRIYTCCQKLFLSCLCFCPPWLALHVTHSKC